MDAGTRSEISPQDLAGAVRQALIEASSAEVANRTPVDLVDRLVAEQGWRLDEAVAWAHRIVRPGARVRALVVVAGHAPDALRRQLLADAVPVCVAAVGPLQPHEAWQALAPALPAELVPAALTAVPDLLDHDQLVALTALAPHLPAELVPDALAIAVAIPDEMWRADALGVLASRVPAELVPAALAAAAAIDDGWRRGTALLYLASELPVGWHRHLSQEQRRQIIAGIIAEPELLNDEAQQMDWRELFTKRLPAELSADVVSAVGRAPNEWAQGFVLAAVARHLSTDLIDSALAAAATLTEPEHRATALGSLLPRLAGQRRKQVLAEVLAAAVATADERARAAILRDLTPHLTAEASDALPAAVATITDPSLREHTRISIVLRQRADGSPQVLMEALEAALAIDDRWYREQVLVDLCSRLPADLVRPALAAVTDAAGIGDETRGRVLAALAPRLPADAAAQAWAAAVAMGEEAFHTGVLAALAHQLPDAMIPEVFVAAADAPDRHWSGTKPRWELLRVIASRLPADLVERAVIATAMIDTAGWRDEDAAQIDPVLTSLVRQLPHQHRQRVIDDALTAVRAGGSMWARTRSLLRLAPHLADGQFPAALAEATALTAADPDTAAVARLVRWLPVGQLPAALATLTRIGDQVAVESVRRALTSQLSTRHAANQAERTPTIRSGPPAGPTDPIKVTTMLPPRWSQAREQVQHALPLTAGTLPELLNRFATMQKTSHEEEARAWALVGLAPHLPADLLPEALATAAAVVDTHDRGGALVGLAPHLPADLLPEALAAGFAIVDPADRTWTLAGLATFLDSAQRRQVVADAQAMRGGHVRARTLARLAPYLPAGLFLEAIVSTTAVEDDTERALLVSALVAAIPPDRRDWIFTSLLATPSHGWRIIDDIVPHLPEELPPALVDTLTATDVDWHGRDVIRALADRMPAASLDTALNCVLAGTGQSDALDTSAAVGTAAVLSRAHALLADRDPARLAALIRQGLRQPTRSACLTVVKAAAASLYHLGGTHAINDCLAALDEVSTRWP
jgi:hypothetical protein